MLRNILENAIVKGGFQYIKIPGVPFEAVSAFIRFLYSSRYIYICSCLFTFFSPNFFDWLRRLIMKVKTTNTIWPKPISFIIFEHGNSYWQIEVCFKLSHQFVRSSCVLGHFVFFSWSLSHLSGMLVLVEIRSYNLWSLLCLELFILIMFSYVAIYLIYNNICPYYDVAA